MAGQRQAGEPHGVTVTVSDTSDSSRSTPRSRVDSVPFKLSWLRATSVSRESVHRESGSSVALPVVSLTVWHALNPSSGFVSLNLSTGHYSQKHREAPPAAVTRPSMYGGAPVTAT